MALAQMCHLPKLLQCANDALREALLRIDPDSVSKATSDVRGTIKELAVVAVKTPMAHHTDLLEFM